MIERIKEDIEFILKKYECKLLFVEDAYRLQTFLDDVCSDLEDVVEEVNGMVRDLEEN